MKWWKVLNRTRDRWVERKRRFLEVFDERYFEAARPRVPALVGARAREAVPNRGAK